MRGRGRMGAERGVLAWVVGWVCIRRTDRCGIVECSGWYWPANGARGEQRTLLTRRSWRAATLRRGQRCNGRFRRLRYVNGSSEHDISVQHVDARARHIVGEFACARIGACRRPTHALPRAATLCHVAKSGIAAHLPLLCEAKRPDQIKITRISSTIRVATGCAGPESRGLAAWQYSRGVTYACGIAE